MFITKLVTFITTTFKPLNVPIDVVDVVTIHSQQKKGNRLNPKEQKISKEKNIYEIHLLKS
jgi:hypothetical protein